MDRQWMYIFRGMNMRATVYISTNPGQEEKEQDTFDSEHSTLCK